MPTQRRVWPPKLWLAALRATQSTSWALCGRRDACEQVRAQHPGWRAWAFDLGQRPGASNHPKRYMAAPVSEDARLRDDRRRTRLPLLDHEQRRVRAGDALLNRRDEVDVISSLRQAAAHPEEAFGRLMLYTL